MDHIKVYVTVTKKMSRAKKQTKTTKTKAHDFNVLADMRKQIKEMK
jgi:hypothetical protein